MSSSNLENLLGEWPDGIGAVVIPGVPGRNIAAESERMLYPGATVDVIKLLREHGIAIDYAAIDGPGAEIEFKAVELWVPIIVFARDVLVEGGAVALVEVIRDRLAGGRRSKAVLHLRVGRADLSTGEVDWFEAEGREETVLQAFSKWSSGDADE